MACSCCGYAVSARDNVWRDEVPYPGDHGTGLCRACGGDPEAKEPQRRLGYATTIFVDARIPLVAQCLSEANRRRFLSLEYEKQAEFVFRCVAKGYLP